ncbi:hypothetical protein FUAX_03600 [Fulvitalea axinellae]|uniref:Uncharacterized protein n=1 Tax=Fulvitalea axinellae TaxID=1182444 RepID=A0AAU9CWG9_9BACT|nr:hypothetical protein FUAX_03600 [Fulvitalea axinellae]
MENETHLIFETEQGSIYQCDTQRRIILDYAGYTTAFRMDNFIQFLRMVGDIDIESKITSESRADDIEIIMPPQTDRCFVLTIRDLIDLTELLEGAWGAICLHAQISEAVVATPAKEEEVLELVPAL